MKSKRQGVDDIFSIYGTGCQSVRTIVAEVHATSPSNHDFNKEHLISSVTHHMKIKNDAGNYIYRSGEEGGGCVYVYVHDATFHP